MAKIFKRVFFAFGQLEQVLHEGGEPKRAEKLSKHIRYPGFAKAQFQSLSETFSFILPKINVIVIFGYLFSSCGSKMQMDQNFQYNLAKS